mmetsp:Transcript_41213/g.131876  ORF Transcript_41213/g.131876 Transcript_41213/m.131876 type:complete len:378 (+) Transcript_41213:137-1270(+)
MPTATEKRRSSSFSSENAFSYKSGMTSARTSKGFQPPRGFARSSSMYSSGTTKGLDIEERLEAAEKLALDLARRLREAEKRAADAEKECSEMKTGLKGLREHVSRKHGIQYGEVEDDSDTFEGFLRMGLPDWWGVCRYGNGDVYEGEWKEGKPHGHGTCSFAHGNQYAGNWCMGGYHGGGRYKYANGDVFEGHWLDDKRHGFGLFTDGQSGEVYEEEYDRGQLKYHKLKPKPGSSGFGGGAGGGAGRGAGGAGGRGGAPSQAERRASQAASNMERRASFTTHASAYTKFEESAPEVITFVNVPWPPAGDALLYDVTNTTAPLAQRKKNLKDLLRRWHPDKWQGRTMAESDREKIMAKVTEIFQRIEQEKQRLDLLQD